VRDAAHLRHAERGEAHVPAEEDTDRYGARHLETTALGESMGLITCADCGNKISDAAAACPKCGRPISAPERADAIRAAKRYGQWKWGAIGVLVVMAAMCSIAQSDRSAPSSAGSSDVTSPSAGTGASAPASPTASVPSVPAAPRRLPDATMVWLSEDAMSDGLGLIVQGVRDPEAIAPYLACLPDAYARYAVLDGGFTKSKIQILSGKAKGCVGWVENEHLPR
jgi:hypothetical protein